MMGNMTGGWGWMTGFGWIFMIPFWALIILGVVALARSLFSTGNSANSGDRRPRDILKERYARGEITRDQYGRMRRDLVS
ncbi:MAG TPA: SHOCT domain-containing protein [Pyrinomonadaceae bacterium]|nr:SHOCT domain-containing protein [Pyrinomonadaceae bacterium]